ncbi:MAG TPA: hypothetical protein VFB34_05375 [Chloroflexota bacterium]|nr:hypothetical protein [Chloroflexota bacterium]
MAQFRRGGHLPIVLLAALCASVALTACGGSSGSDRYVDSSHYFSLKLPKGWVGPKHGSPGQFVDGQPSYVAQFIHPTGFRVVIHLPLQDLTSVPNGKVLTHQSACPTICVFHRLKVDGWPALRAEVISNAGKLTQDSVDVNTAKHGYELQLLAYPYITKALDAQFHQLVLSFRIPSGK